MIRGVGESRRVELPLIILQEVDGGMRCNAPGCDLIDVDPYRHAADVHGITDEGDVYVVHPDDHDPYPDDH